MNPLAVADDVRRTYRRYISTRFPLGKMEPALRAEFGELLRSQEGDRAMFRGPVVELTAPYVLGESLSQLSQTNPQWGLLTAHFRRTGAFDCDRPLYSHQAESLRRANRRNLVIASGTGSGKTECFLLPIIQHCLANPGPGVRAIMVYPLNALVEDQLRRLDSYLAGSQVTFGKYTGQTPRSSREQDRLSPNHLVGRDEMRESPPNILITNYAMLEYLLIRPADSKLLECVEGAGFRFLVLDEAHTYTGATGTEIAFLIRRLKSKVGRKDAGLRCFATSATLGISSEAREATAFFAHRLFGAPFAPEDVIIGERQCLSASLPTDPRSEVSAEAIAGVWPSPTRSPTLEQAARIIQNIDAKESEPLLRIAEYLSTTSCVRAILEILEREGPTPLSDLANKVFPTVDEQTAQQAIVCLVGWGNIIESRSSTSTLIPARYHMFVSKTKGLFCELSNNGGWEHLALTQHGISELPGNPYPFELAVCRICGIPYVFGVFISTDDGTLKYKPQADTFFEQLESEHDQAWNKILCFGKPNIPSTEHAICKYCGTVDSPCEHGSSSVIRLYALGGANDIDLDGEAVEDPTDVDGQSGCLNCSSGKALEKVILPLRLSENGLTAPIVTSFYTHCPPMLKTDIEATHDIYRQKHGSRNRQWTPITGEGRKLLIFSDSRQNAAYFGPYLQVSHVSLLMSRFFAGLPARDITTSIREWRNQGVSNLRHFCYERENATFLLDGLRPRKDFIRETMRADEESKLAHRVYYGICSLIGREGSMVSGLEGCGIAAVHLNDQDLSSSLKISGLQQHQTLALAQLVARHIRLAEAFALDPISNVNLSQRDVYFGQLHDTIVLTSYEDKIRRKNVFRLISKNPNRLQSIVLQALQRFNPGPSYGISDANEIIHQIADVMKSEELRPLKNGGFKLDIDTLFVTYAEPSSGLFANSIPGGLPRFKACKRCGRLSWIDLANLCNYPGCGGELTSPTASLQFSDENHYRNWFLSQQGIPELRAAEHTAQLDKTTAARDYQDEFKDGRLNILSCSTTFEMGVDLGDLTSVFMRNIPPSVSSYIQRAGRAGRRIGQTPFVLTFCRALPHDQYFFERCETLVKGQVSPPTVVLENAKILTRHLKAIVLSAFLRRFREAFTIIRNGYSIDPRCCDFFEVSTAFQDLVGTTSGTLSPVQFMCDNWVPQVYQELKEGFGATFSHDFLDSPDFLELLIAKLGETIGKHPMYGFLGGAYKDYFETTKYYRNQLSVLDPRKPNERKDYDFFSALLKQTKEKQLISYLSSRGLLPSYAFPTNVVPLKVLSDVEGANSLDLNRELGRAISEYAPGSTVVANAKVYIAGALHKYPRQQFRLYYYRHCAHCHWFSCTEDRTVLADIQKCPKCTSKLTANYSKAILPEWGFAVCRSDEPVSISRNTKLARAGFSSELYVNADSLSEVPPTYIDLPGCKLAISFSNGYRMVRINTGPLADDGTAGFHICRDCGRALERNGRSSSEHRSPYLGACETQYGIVGDAHLISFFDTDALTISFAESPQLPAQANTPGFHWRAFWRTVLYSFIQSLSLNFEIAREDLDGIYLPHPQSSSASLVLIDGVSGGAGHVARLVGKDGSNIHQSFTRLIQGAHDLLNCEMCAADSACYSCLFHSSNQKVQHTLNRGLALPWVRSLTTG